MWWWRFGLCRKWPAPQINKRPRLEFSFHPSRRTTRIDGLDDNGKAPAKKAKFGAVSLAMPYEDRLDARIDAGTCDQKVGDLRGPGTHPAEAQRQSRQRRACQENGSNPIVLSSTS